MWCVSSEPNTHFSVQQQQVAVSPQPPSLPPTPSPTPPPQRRILQEMLGETARLGRCFSKPCRQGRAGTGGRPAAAMLPCHAMPCPEGVQVLLWVSPQPLPGHCGKGHATGREGKQQSSVKAMSQWKGNNGGMVSPSPSPSPIPWGSLE